MRVLLTRQPAQAGDLEAGLAGAEVAGRRLRVGFLPLTDFALPDDDGPLRALLADWAGADGDAVGPVRSDGPRWLVVTSPNTVRALRAVGWDGHVPAGARIAVTGPGTARVLTEAGCDAAPWLPPEDRSAEGLIAGLAALHPRGARAQAGRRLLDGAADEGRGDVVTPARLAEVAAGTAVVLTSSSAAEEFVAAGLTPLVGERVRLVAIGAPTRDTCARRGLPLLGTAPTPDAAGVLAVLRAAA